MRAARRRRRVRPAGAALAAAQCAPGMNHCSHCTCGAAIACRRRRAWSRLTRPAGRGPANLRRRPAVTAFLRSASLALVWIAALHGTLAAAADASSPLGLWKTFDDKTGSARAIVRIYEQDGKFFGRIETQLRPRGRAPCVRRLHGRPQEPTDHRSPHHPQHGIEGRRVLGRGHTRSGQRHGLPLQISPRSKRQPPGRSRLYRLFAAGSNPDLAAAGIAIVFSCRCGASPPTRAANSSKFARHARPGSAREQTPRRRSDCPRCRCDCRP